MTGDAQATAGSRGVDAPPPPRRRLVVALVAAQILIPAVLLGVRIADPGVGQVPFGWQMHTACWGDESACR